MLEGVYMVFRLVLENDRKSIRIYGGLEMGLECGQDEVQRILRGV